MNASSSTQMLKIIKIKLQDWIKCPQEYDPTEREKLLHILEKKSPAEFVKAFAIWIYSNEINFNGKTPWTKAYDDPWIGSVLQAAWNDIEWNA